MPVLRARGVWSVRSGRGARVVGAWVVSGGRRRRVSDAAEPVKRPTGGRRWAPDSLPAGTGGSVSQHVPRDESVARRASLPPLPAALPVAAAPVGSPAESPPGDADLWKNAALRGRIGAGRRRFCDPGSPGAVAASRRAGRSALAGGWRRTRVP